MDLNRRVSGEGPPEGENDDTPCSWVVMRNVRPLLVKSCPLIVTLPQHLQRR